MNYAKKRNLFLWFLLIIPVLIGCSSKPPVSAAKEQFEKTIVKSSDCSVKIIIFEKINALEKNEYGVKKYLMECRAEVEVIEDCYYTRWRFTKRPLMSLGVVGGDKVKRGDKMSFLGTVVFEKTEKGWRSTGIIPMSS